MKRFIGTALGACLLLALAVSSAQAQEPWPYAVAKQTSPTTIKVTGLGATGSIACWEGAVLGNQFGSYISAETTDIPMDCVGLLESWTGPGCGGTLENTSDVDVDGCLPPPPAPGVPSINLGVIGAFSIQVSWTDVADATDYDVFYCESAFCPPGPEPNILAPGSPVASGVETLTVAGLKDGTTYFFEVCANGPGGTTCSAPSAALTDGLVAPTNLMLSALSTTEIQASWDDSNGENYEVFYCEVGVDCGGGGQPTMSAGVVAPGVEMLTKDGLKPGTMYHFDVCALADGESECAGFTGISTQTLDPPTNLMLNALSATEVQVNWDDSNGEDYEVFYCEVGVNCGGGGQPTMSAGVVASGVETFTKDALKPDTSYHFDVCARADGSVACAGFTGISTQTLDPPTNVALNVLSTTEIKVSWTDSNGTQYDVFYCEVAPGYTCGGADNPTTPAAGNPVAPGMEMLLLDGLNSDTTYNVKVCALVDGSPVCSPTEQATTDPGGLALVPQTGLDTCYDADGFVIACPGLPPMDPPFDGAGQDGNIMAGVPSPSPRYSHADPRCGGAAESFLDRFTDLCWLYDPCNHAAVCAPLTPTNWYDTMLNSTDVCLTGANCISACTGADGSVPGDWRVANINEVLSHVDWSNLGNGTDPPFSQELIDLITANAPASALTSCWDQHLFTSTTAFAGSAPGVLPNSGQYEQAMSVNWVSSTLNVSTVPADKVDTMPVLMVKDAADP